MDDADRRTRLAEGGLESLTEAWTGWVGALPVATDMLKPTFLETSTMEPPAVVEDLIAKDPFLRSVENLLNLNPLHEVVPVDWAEIARALRTVWLRQMRRPETAYAAMLDLTRRQMEAAAAAWSDVFARWFDLSAGRPAPDSVGDKRFAAPEWHLNPAFRTLKDCYLIASDWLMHRPDAFDDLTPTERRNLDFHLRQFVNATSPTLMFLSNPAAVRRAIETGGASIAQGMRNLMADLEEGRLSLVDANAFAPGRNLALSPGKVVYRNKLIELIQYSPKTEQVHAIPILFVPPWINKFYILDLNPKKSLVRHLVEAGFTVFTISWRNPDQSLEDTTIDDYLELGPLAASDVVREITGAPRINIMGYCIGGTLLAMTLAWCAAKRDDRFNAATFMVSLQDFETVGDTAVFLSEQSSLQLIEHQMMERGYLDKSELSNMFNLLRSNDLIWANVVNNYLMGEKPPAFDLLYWNSDGTRMARAAHAWYLRNTYVENKLVKPGEVELKGERLDLSRITLDVYAVGAEKDHIVPWHAAARILELTGGQVRYVLASSGHIAGIINPPGGKGNYWTNENGRGLSPEAWRAGSTQHEGSWWRDWFAWLGARSGEMRTPPRIGSDRHPPMEDAPGTYVFER